MTGVTPPCGVLASRQGQARPPPEPAIRPRKGAGRRVGATLPCETYVAFKAYVAREGITGEQAIVEAVDRLVGDREAEPLRH